jgi:predicted RNA binding protein YcfA (HicA-like mRNA interferase family)
MNPRRLLARIARGDLANVAFGDMLRLVEAVGFEIQRTAGSHHIYAHPEIPGLVNLQNADGEAKPYQIRQFLRLVDRYALRVEDDR